MILKFEEFINEYIEHVDLSPCKQFNEFINHYGDAYKQGRIFVSFRSSNEYVTNINPYNEFNTPIGFYAYPLKKLLKFNLDSAKGTCINILFKKNDILNLNCNCKYFDYYGEFYLDSPYSGEEKAKYLKLIIIKNFNNIIRYDSDWNKLRKFFIKGLQKLIEKYNIENSNELLKTDKYSNVDINQLNILSKYEYFYSLHDKLKKENDYIFTHILVNDFTHAAMFYNIFYFLIINLVHDKKIKSDYQKYTYDFSALMREIGIYGFLTNPGDNEFIHDIQYKTGQLVLFSNKQKSSFDEKSEFYIIEDNLVIKLNRKSYKKNKKNKIK